MKKILISSDFIMTQEIEQKSNGRWVKDLLAPAITRVTGLNVEEFYSTLISDGEEFSRKKFFELSNIDLDIDKVQFLYDVNDISEKSLKYLQSFFSNKDLLIGYELSEQTRFLFDKINIKYIDFWLNPIRYIDDILFSFYSNDEKIYNSFKEFEFNNEYIYNYATKIKIQNYKGWKRYTHPIMPNSAVFFGQILEDKAVNKDGKMLNLLDFKKEIEDKISEYNMLYYVRHPYVKKGDEKILEYVKNHPKMSLVNYPSYFLISHENIKEVISISSSLVHEAKYFNKKTTFFYKSILNFGNDFKNKEYITVYQDFISNYFWSKVLSSFTKTINVKEKITFLNDKDKIRDMLNFYWSYKQVDKIEHMRGTLLALDRKFQNKFNKNNNKIIPKKAKQINYKIKKGIDVEVYINNLKNEIDKYNVISFDIFDTVVLRPFYTPNDLFKFMEKEVKEKYGIDNFVELRGKLRNFVKNNKDCEEVNLDDRYLALCEEIGISSDLALKLMNFELELEQSILEERPLMKELYRYAIEKGKKVIFVSDTFYDREFIENILKKTGYNGFYRIFLSSEECKLKHTGNLYPIVLDKMNIKKEDILHIGDNKISDIEKCKKNGIAPLYIPSVCDNFKNNKSLDSSFVFSNKNLESITKGLIAKKFFDINDNYDSPSLFNGKPYNLGYTLVGIFFHGFITSLIEKSIKDNIDTLFFLSRDGHIIKRVYDEYSKYYENAPKSKYIYASRRSLNVVSIFNIEDAKEIINKKFTPCNINKFMFNRFGINVDLKEVKEAGFEKLDSIVDYFQNLDKLEKLIYICENKILKQASNERNEFISVYKKKGFLDGNNGIVDIGHEGTLQNKLFKLMNKNINGYYFATFSEIESKVEMLGMKTWGYIGEKISDKNHFYKKNILLFENLFLNTEGSFLYFKNGEPILLDTSNETARKEFSEQLHNGIVDFNKDLLSIINSKIIDFNIENPITLVQPYLNFLDNPYISDLLVFKNINFENNYNCIKETFLIKIVGNKAIAEASLWGNAVEIYNFYNKKFSLFSFNHKKFRKFKNDPYSFFSDSKNPIIRKLAFFYKI